LSIFLANLSLIFFFEKFIIEFNVNLSTLLYGDDKKFVKNRKQTFIFYNLFEEHSSLPPNMLSAYVFALFAKKNKNYFRNIIISITLRGKSLGEGSMQPTT
jgi:hypothetical protein